LGLVGKGVREAGKAANPSVEVEVELGAADPKLPRLKVLKLVAAGGPNLNIDVDKEFASLVTLRFPLEASESAEAGPTVGENPRAPLGTPNPDWPNDDCAAGAPPSPYTGAEGAPYARAPPL